MTIEKLARERYTCDGCKRCEIVEEGIRPTLWIRMAIEGGLTEALEFDLCPGCGTKALTALGPIAERALPF
jgi:hypothetical protein